MCIKNHEVQVVESANGVFVVGVLVTFAVLVALAVPGVDVSNLARSNWDLVAPAVRLHRSVIL
jgi:hypothetical protein